MRRSCRKQRRRERWIIYVVSAVLVAVMAMFLAHDDLLPPTIGDVMTGWDFAIPIVGAAAALLVGGAMYVSRRAQVLREQRFGDSLRDQLDRRIAQLDDRATIARETLVSVLLGDLSDGDPPPRPRINDKSISDDGYLLVTLILHASSGRWRAASGGTAAGATGVLPRKRRLEALLKELDAP